MSDAVCAALHAPDVHFDTPTAKSTLDSWFNQSAYILMSPPSEQGAAIHPTPKGRGMNCLCSVSPEFNGTWLQLGG